MTMIIFMTMTVTFGEGQQTRGSLFLLPLLPLLPLLSLLIFFFLFLFFVFSILFFFFFERNDYGLRWIKLAVQVVC